jgi:hypothetical protein
MENCSHADISNSTRRELVDDFEIRMVRMANDRRRVCVVNDEEDIRNQFNDLARKSLAGGKLQRSNIMINGISLMHSLAGMGIKH